MKKSKGKGIRRVLLGILLLCLALGCIYHEGVRVVWGNLTAGKLPLSDSQEWEEGDTYLGLAYAADSDRQYLDLYVPRLREGEVPKLFVLIHGGRFIAGDSRTRQAQFMYRFFRDRGYACASLSYRLAQEAPFPAGLSDCKAAIRFLRAHAKEYGYDATKICVWGESAGGYLAVMCGLTSDEEFSQVSFVNEEKYEPVSSKVDIVVDYYGVIDFYSMEEDWRSLHIPSLVVKVGNYWIDEDSLGGYEDVQSYWRQKNLSQMSEEEYARSDPYTYLNNKDLEGLQVWMIHGDCDITVPILHSERLFQALVQKLGQDKVTYQRIPGLGHASDLLYTDEILEGLDAYLKERLG